MAMYALKHGSERSATRALSIGNRVGLNGQLLVWTTVGPLVRFGLPKCRARGDGILAAEFEGLG